MKMSVDIETTKRMAKAAHIRLSDDELLPMMSSLNDILDMCSLVGELDTTGVPDHSWSMKRRAPRRGDVVSVWNRRDDLMQSAPTAEDDLFRVPRIISEDQGR